MADSCFSAQAAAHPDGPRALTRRLTRIAVFFLIALAGSRCHREAAVRSFANAPVILISIDTVRADHLPMFGYRQVATPNLDALRRDGILYTSAWSHVPLTLPSHVSVLTGLLPQDNGVRNNIGYKLDPKVPTLPLALKANGYDTGAAISAYVLRGNAGLGSSFDSYDDAVAFKAGTAVGALQRPGSYTTEAAERWIGAHEGRPFFFFLHLFEPHSPYEPPEPFKSRYANPYDGEIAAADGIAGAFLDFLKKRDLYDKAIIIFMSDHGEGLYQHGEPEHGIFLYREVLHVPLVLKLPGQARAGETVGDPVGLIDIMPTVLELTRTRGPAKLPGVSLLAHPPAAGQRRIYSETLYPRIHLGWSELRSLEGSDFHFIQAPKPELYDVVSDPGETKNVLMDQRRVYASMKADLDAYGNKVDIPTSINREEAAKLTALGYLGSAAPKATGPLPDPKDRIGEVADMMVAMRFVTQHQDEQAIDALRAIIRKNPRLSDAWNQLALTLENVGRYEEAADAYRKAIDISPDLAGEFGLSLGSILLKMEKFDEAAAHARLGERVNPGGAHTLLARIALARQDYPTAEREARIGMNDEFAHNAAGVVLAQALVQENHLQPALAIIDDLAKNAEEKHLGSIDGLEFTRGDILARMNRYDEAIAAFRKEIAAYPHSKQPYANLALVYALQGKTGDAYGALEEMGQANPNKRTYLFAAHTLEQLNDPRGAAVWRKRAQSVR
jgi:arylsulfatase A-like enzyme/Tfp pilus assembly protein PilF